MTNEAVGRREMHMRRIEMRAYARDDGLWDVEAHLRDEKPFVYLDPGRGEQPPHAPVHEVLVPMARVVRQGMSLGREPDGKVALVPDPALTEKPFFVDDCHSWRADGAVVARFYPQFSRRGPMFK